MAELDKAVAADLAHRIMAHVSFHSTYIAPPALYQYVIPDGRYLDLEDQAGESRRLLRIYSKVGVTGWYKQRSGLLTPRGLPVDSPWFVGYTDKQLKRDHGALAETIRFCYRQNNDVVRPDTIVIDPMQTPTRLEIPADWPLPGLNGLTGGTDWGGRSDDPSDPTYGRSRRPRADG